MTMAGRMIGTWMLAALLALGAEALEAQTITDPVVEQLRQQGYVEFEVSRTLLGRVRVIALMPGGGRREIVINPATGEILRDRFDASDEAPPPHVGNRPDSDPPADDGRGGGATASDGDRSGGQGQGNGGNRGGGGQGNGNGNGGREGNGGRD